MTPAVFLFGIACALIQNAESQQIVCPREVTGQEGQSVSIVCPYSTNPKANKHIRKYCCEEGYPNKCKYTIASTDYIHQNYLGRVSIIDNKEEGFIVFKFSGLEKTDERTYICGLDTDAKPLKAVFKMMIITEGSDIPNEAKLLYGPLMGAVNFQCEFGDQHAEQRKYMCKMGKNGCMKLIDSLGKVDTAYTGRITLQQDESKPARFTVKMIELTTRDSGIYFCGIGNYGEEDYREFDLRINSEAEDDIRQGPRLKTRLGGSVTAQCKYDPEIKYTSKLWCKWEGSGCTPLIGTGGFVKDGYEGKLAMYDDHTNGRMQVVMNQLSKSEEGWYWIVLTNGKNDQISTVQIKISEENPEGLSGGKTIYAKKGETVKMSCYSPCRYKSYEKYWCKWNNFNCTNMTTNVALHENGLSVSCDPQELSLTIESASQNDNGWYWCGVNEFKQSGIYIKDTIVVRLSVEEPTRVVPNSDIRPRFAVVPGEDPTPPSINENKENPAVPAALSVCAVVLVASAVFFIIRQKRKRNADLVSVGSYRTNISMTDLDNDIGKENPAVIDTQETDISHSCDGAKIKKKGSQEDLDYSSFLIHHNGSPNEENTT